MLFEYFYNGAADGAAPAAIPSDRLETRRRHFAGFSAGTDLTPLWRLGGLVLADLEKHSYALAPSVTWSAAEDIEAVFAFQFFAGDPASEYGDGEHVLFTRIEVFFLTPDPLAGIVGRDLGHGRRDRSQWRS